MSGFASGVLAGQRMAQGWVDQFRQGQQREELAQVQQAVATESKGFTAEQGAEIEKAAQQDPLMGYDQAKGAYVYTPAIPDGQTGPVQQQTIAQQGVTDFLGQRTAGSMSPDQVGTARSRAMADVISKYDPIAGARMASDARREARDDKRFDWEESRAKREMRMAQEQDEEKASGKALDEDVGKWFSGRLKNPDGTDRAASVDDHLAASQYRAAKLTQSGKVEKAGQVLKDHAAQSFVKLQLEGAERDQALGRAAAGLAAGDLDGVKDFFNKHVPDGSRVLDVKRGANGQITIQRETMDGRPMPEMVMKDVGQLTAGLAAFKDPMAIYNWSQNEFKNTLALKADARADKSLAIQASSAGESSAARAQTRGDAAAKAAAGVALYKEQHPSATPAQIEAVRTGLLSAVPGTDKNAPSEVKLAKAMVEAGLAPDMKAGIEMAVTKKSQSPSEMHKEFVAANVKAFQKPDDAVKGADEIMRSMGYRKSGGSWSMGSEGGAAAVPAADQRTVGKTYDTPRGKMIWRGTGWEPAK